MSDTGRARSLLLRAFVFFIAFLVVLGWGLSWIKALPWMAPLAFAGFCGVAVYVVRLAGSVRIALNALAEPLSFWPAVMLIALRLIGALAYPPAMLDSLTYRLPRIWLWLQERGIHPVLSVESRLDFMPQVWELSTVPLIQIAADRLVWFWTSLSWVVLYLVTYDWALEGSDDTKKSRRIAFIASTSAFAVLQAGSSANDLFATALVVLSLRFVVAFERTRDWRWIAWAVLSFCLAAGTKPHYSVLGLPLILWFLFASSRPWRSFRWAWAPALVPLWLLCSPAPTFVLNQLSYGSWAGRGQDSAIFGGSPFWNVVLGSASVAWHSVQPPVNPLALVLNEPLNQSVAAAKVNELVPQFSLNTTPVAMVDGAGLGLVTAILLAAGILLALKSDRGLLKSWRGWALLAGLAGGWLALSRFVPGTAGRAYCGFLHLAIPLAIAGWNLMKPRTVQIAAYFCLANALLLVIFDPARPLWPASQVQRALANSPRFSRFAEKLQPYLLVQERAIAGEEVARGIPAGESVVALVPVDRPLLPLFRPYGSGRKVIFLRPRSKPAELERLPARYFIVCEGAELDYPELCEHIERSGEYERVLQRDYTSRLARGPETWTLYRRKPSATAGQLRSQDEESGN